MDGIEVVWSAVQRCISVANSWLWLRLLSAGFRTSQSGCPQLFLVWPLALSLSGGILLMCLLAALSAPSKHTARAVAAAPCGMGVLLGKPQYSTPGYRHHCVLPLVLHVSGLFRVSWLTCKQEYSHSCSTCLNQNTDLNQSCGCIHSQLYVALIT